MTSAELLIKEIKERNVRVEADKVWEVSKTRRGIIAVATYFVIVLFLFMIDAPMPWLTALVPVVAFILSTLTMPFLKRWWLKRVYKK